MPTPIRIKRSSVSGKRPGTSQLDLGELAINFYDGSLFIKRDTGGVGIGTTVVNITPWQEKFNSTDISYIGNVGVGTDNITAKLDVAGTTKTQQLNVSGVSTLGITNVTDLTGQQLNVSGVSTFQGDVRITDDDKLRFGTSSGGILQIYTNGNNSFFKQTSGDLKYELADQFIVQKDSGDEPIAIFNSDSDVELYYDGSKKFETTGYGVTVFGTSQTQQLNVTGVSTFQGNVNLGDNDQINIGDGSDLKLYHDGSNSYVEDAGVGALIMKGSTIRFRSTTNENIISASQNGSVNLYYDNSKKFETTNTGAKVTGDLEVTGVVSYDDVTNVDSIGIITARTDLHVGAGLSVAGVSTFTGSIRLPDSSGNDIGRIFLGANDDLQIHHTGSNSVISNTTGDLIIRDDSEVKIRTNEFVVKSGDDTENLIRANKNGEVKLYYDNSNKFETTGIGVTIFGNIETQTLNVSGVSTFQSHVHLGDDDELRFGASNDFKIVHDPNDCRFENSNGDIKFKNTGSYFFFDEDGGETLASFINDGAINLFHSGNKKFETTSSGIDVTGHTETDTLNVSGVPTFQDNVKLTTDNKRLIFGDNDDLEIFHNGVSNYIVSNTGSFNIKSPAFQFFLGRGSDGLVRLFHGSSTRFETTGAGVTVFGTTQTQQLNVSGVSTFTDTTNHSFIRITRTNNSNALSLVNTSTANGAYVDQRFVIDGHSRAGIRGQIDGANLGGRLKFYTAANTQELTQRAVIDQQGRFGINVNSPTETLDVGGTTQTEQLNVTGVSTFQGNVDLGDDDKIILGDGDDLQIYHDGSHSYIQESGVGNLKVLTNSFILKNSLDNEFLLKATQNSSVELLYDNSKKFETTSSGAKITGDLEVTGVLSYDDVTNIDSVGIVTARSGIHVTGGNVGVGTNNPNRKLVVEGSGNTFASIKAGTSDDVGLIFGDTDNDARGLVRYTNADDSLSLWTGGTKKIHITSSGKVGINESNNINGRLHIQHDALNENILYATRYNDQSNDKPIFAVTEATMSGMTSPGLIIGNHNRDIHIGSVFDNAAGIYSSDTTGIRITSNGRVGIGTVPNNNATLDIRGNGASVIRLNSNNFNSHTDLRHNQSGKYFEITPSSTSNQSFIVNKPNGDEALRINSAGKVGIGTDIPSDILDILTGSGDEVTSLKVKTAGQVELSRNHSSAPYIKTLMASGNPNIILGDSGGDKVKINGDGASYFNGGNVGIGTDNPDTLLNLFGTGNTTIKVHNNAAGAGTYSRLQFITGGVGSSARSEIRSLRMSSASAATNLAFFTTTAGDTSPTERLRISSTGSVGIGTDNPTALLHVQNNSVSDTKIVVESTGTNSYPALRLKNDARTYDLGIDGATDDFRVYDITGAAERLRITSDGDVGIGINSPLGKLHLSDTNHPLIIDDNSTNVDQGIVFTSGGSSSYNAAIRLTPSGNSTQKGLRFHTGGYANSKERLRITSGGYVGINRDTPTNRLHVKETNSNTIVGRMESSVEYAYLSIEDNSTTTGNVRVGAHGNDLVMNAGANQWLRITSDGKVRVPDNGKFVAGNGDDLEIYHDGTHSRISDEGSGSLLIQTNGTNIQLNKGTSENMLVAIPDGAVELYHNNNKKLETGQYGVTVTGSLAASNIELEDNGKLLIGTGDDLQIFHDGSNNYIQFISGNLILKNNTADYFIGNNSTGSVELNYNGSKKFETTSSGAKITGNLEVTGVLTYDDVTNIDSVGIVTAQSGIDITGGNLTIPDKIIHSGDTNTSIRFPANDTIRLSTSGSSRLDVTPNGHILLGTTGEPSGGDAHAQNARLLVQGRIGNTADSGRLNLQRGSAASNGSSIGSISFTDNSNNAYARIETFADAATGSNDYPGRIVFSTTNDGASTPTEKLRITSDGKVGINKIPEKTLDITSDGTAGIIQISGARTFTGNNAFFAGRSSRGTIASPATLVANDIISTFSANAHDGSNYLPAGRLRFGVDSISTGNLNSHLQFIVSNNGEYEAMRIKSDGKVGIGTDNPEARLHTYGGNVILEDQGGITVNLRRNDTSTAANRLLGAIQFQGNDSNGTYETGAIIKAFSDIAHGTGDKPSRLEFHTTPDNSATPVERLRITSDGKVGIGTDNPQTRLEVYSASNNNPSEREIRINVSDVPASDHSYGLLRIVGNGNLAGKYFIGYNNDHTYQPNQLSLKNSDGDITFYNANNASPTEKVRIDSSGRLLVGVSTSSANTKFLIQGGTASNNANIFLARSNAPSGTTTGNKELGSIAFSANNHAASAVILGERDGGTWTNGVSQPTRLVFSSTADGSSSPTERLRITSDGDITTSSSITTQTSTTFYENNRRVLEVHGGTTQGWLTVGATRTDTDAYVGGINFLNRHGQIDNHRFLGYIRLKSTHVNTGVYGTNVLKGQLEFATKSSSAGISTTTPDMVIAASGNVGIGTDNPTSLIHAQNNSVSDTKIVVESTGTNSYPALRLKNDARTYDLGIDGATDALRVYDVTAAAERLRITTDGTIQLSNLSSVYTSGTATRFSLFNGTNNHYGLHVGHSYDLNYNAGGSVSSGKGEHRFHTAAQERLRITSDGNVGIGTDNPVGLLHLQSTSVSQSVLTISTNNGRSANIKSPISNDINAPFTFNTGNAWAFNADGIRILTLSSDYEVGIRTDAPTSPLDILLDAGAGDPRIRFNVTQDDPYIELNRWTGVGSNYHGIRSRSRGSDLIFEFADSSTTIGNHSYTERLRIKSGGRVGIGTDNPQDQIHVSGTSDFIVDTDSSSTLRFGSYGEYDIALVTGRNTPTGSSRVHIENGDGEALRITSGGNVGINSASPATGLDIRSDDGIFVRTVSNTPTNGARIQFSDQTSATQRGHIKYKHSDNAVSPGSNDGFLIGGTENLTVVKVEGRALIDEKVGIGTDVLDASLQINVGSAVTALDIQGSEGQLFSVTNNLTSGSIFSVNDVSGIPSIDVDANGTILLAPYGINENVGIGTTNPSQKLDVIGNVKATNFNTTSDQNLKTNIHKIENPLEKVVEIRGVNFEWKQNNKSSVGVIAQEVEKVLPELVTDSGTKTVNYNGLIGLLIEVVKEQQEQINSLNSRLSKLE